MPLPMLSAYILQTLTWPGKLYSLFGHMDIPYGTDDLLNALAYTICLVTFLTIVTVLTRKMSRRLFNLKRHAKTTKGRLRFATIKSHVNSVVFSVGRAHPDNSHCHAAARRSAANKHITAVCALINAPVFSLSKSTVDGYRNVNGNRLFYDVKDLAKFDKPEDKTPNPGDIVKMVDVISHLSKKEFNSLIDGCDGIAAYTFKTESAGFRSDEVSVVWDQKTKRYNFSMPDGKYNQELWDFTEELLTSRRFYFDRPALGAFVALGLVTIYLLSLLELARDPQIFLWTPTTTKYCYTWTDFILRFMYFGLNWEQYVDNRGAPLFSYFYPTIKTLTTTITYPHIHVCREDYMTTFVLAYVILACLFLLLCSLRIRSRVCQVLRHDAGYNRMSVWIIPNCNLGTLQSLLWFSEITKYLPRRFQPYTVTSGALDKEGNPLPDMSVHGVQVITPTGRYLNLNLNGSDLRMTFTQATVDAVKAFHCYSGSAVKQGSLQVTLKALKLKHTATELQTLITFLKTGLEAPSTTEALSSLAFPFYYTAGPRGGDSKRPNVQPFMEALLPGRQMAANICRENDQAFVDKRVVDVRPPIVHMTTHMVDLMNEFTDHLCQDGPTHIDRLNDILKRQNSVQQKASIDFAEEVLPAIAQREYVKSFQKAESYNGFKDPRGITVFSPLVKYAMSLVSYAVSSVCKTTKWYAFGKHPDEIATRMAEVLKSAKTNFAETDFSRMDGTVTAAIRCLDEMIIRKSILPEYVEFALAWYEMVYLNCIKTSTGLIYEQGTAQGSGDPLTSVMNTCRSAFVAYCYLRRSMQSEQAWEALGIYGGDDGGTADVDENTLTDVAKQWGFKMTSDVKLYGERTTFLSRIYGPGAWEGDSSNCCDLPRALGQFNLSTKVNDFTKTRIGWLKAMSYVTTDGNTPLMGDLVQKLLTDLKDEQFDDHEKFLRWSAQKDLHHGVTTARDRRPWMDDYAAECFDGLRIAEFMKWAKTPATPWNKPPPLKLVPLPETITDHLVDDVLFEEEQEEKEEEKEDEEPAPSVGPAPDSDPAPAIMKAHVPPSVPTSKVHSTPRGGLPRKPTFPVAPKRNPVKGGSRGKPSGSKKKEANPPQPSPRIYDSVVNAGARPKTSVHKRGPAKRRKRNKGKGKKAPPKP